MGEVVVRNLIVALGDFGDEFFQVQLGKFHSGKVVSHDNLESGINKLGFGELQYRGINVFNVDIGMRLWAGRYFQKAKTRGVVSLAVFL